MSILRSFSSRLATYLSIYVCFCVVLFSSCSGKQSSNQSWVDSVLESYDSIPDDSLVFSVEDAPVSQTVDEYFIDFLFTFTHNKQFQKSRTCLPISILNRAGEVVQSVSSVEDINDFLDFGSLDCYFMLLHDVSQLESDYMTTTNDVVLSLVDLDDSSVKNLGCERVNGEWHLNRAAEFSLDSFSYGNFLHFYHNFAVDNDFQTEHVAQPLNISIPDEEEDGHFIEGTIDANQFSVFSPELPHGKLLLLDYDNHHADETNKVVMVKCGLGSGMMDIMTFAECDGDWKLTSIEQ